MSVLYHPDKVNVVTDALSRISMGSVSYFPDGNKQLGKKVHRLAQLDVRYEDSPKGGSMVHHNFEISLLVEVKSKQHLYPLLMELKKSVLSKFNETLSKRGRDKYVQS